MPECNMQRSRERLDEDTLWKHQGVPADGAANFDCRRLLIHVHCRRLLTERRGRAIPFVEESRQRPGIDREPYAIGACEPVYRSRPLEVGGVLATDLVDKRQRATYGAIGVAVRDHETDRWNRQSLMLRGGRLDRHRDGIEADA